MTDHDILIELKLLRAEIKALPKAITAAIVADLLEPIEPPAPPSAECQHPVDQRVDLGDGEWQCKVRMCGFHFVPSEVSV